MSKQVARPRRRPHVSGTRKITSKRSWNIIPLSKLPQPTGLPHREGATSDQVARPLKKKKNSFRREKVGKLQISLLVYYSFEQ